MSTCAAVIPGRGVCGRPSRGRLHPGNTPACGIHLRGAMLRGEEISYDDEEN